MWNLFAHFGWHGVHPGKRHWWRLLALTALVLWCLAGRTGAVSPQSSSRLSAQESLPAEAALDLRVLRSAYPDAVAGMERGASGHLELVLKDGTRLVYDDGRARTPEEAEQSPDIRTMLAQVYPLGRVSKCSAYPEPGVDPGRHRVLAFFEALYGHSEDEVRSHCRPVAFDGHAAPFNARHGAAAALERVWARLAPQSARHPEWRHVLRPFGGTLCWRAIADTERLSPHSFGMAVDLNPHLAYWLTEAHPERVPGQVLAFPPQIVEAFEAEGFIWGGKWAAFDLMHFEYRPELVLKARLLRDGTALPHKS